jgi:hypothetical protein
VCIFHRSHACYIPRPCYPLTTSGEVQTTELPSMQLLAVSPAPCSSVWVRYNRLWTPTAQETRPTQTSIWNCLSL